MLDGTSFMAESFAVVSFVVLKQGHLSEAIIEVIAPLKLVFKVIEEGLESQFSSHLSKVAVVEQIFIHLLKKINIRLPLQKVRNIAYDKVLFEFSSRFVGQFQIFLEVGFFSKFSFSQLPA
ncbi:hypothetical protein Adt_06439 [Abeliophyllum distichum]|uniref:Uncharacterized protein n=1 Tax=Abeliophyllum distichum TaxID=126358 RepID=A0ABD1V959_9LAMI